MQQNQPEPGARRYAFAGLIALVGAAMLVHQWYWTRPLWVDEEMIALNLRDRRITELVGSLWMNQSAPLGWLAVERLLLLVVGASERALRALPVLFGVGTLALTVVAGRRWMGPVGAAVFALLCSFGVFIAFFPLEIKPYSADVFFGLLMPVLAVWALEAKPAPSSHKPGFARLGIWWLVAVAAQWFANGALFAAAASACAVCGVIWYRAGWRRASLAALPGLFFAASFALHYELALRHSVENDYLQSYWASALPPSEAGVAGILRWALDQFQQLANNPGGTRLWIAFWLSALGGIALVCFNRPAVGVLLLTLPLFAFALAAFRLVPLSGRLFLWALPALYMGVAFSADRAASLASMSFRQRKWPQLAVGLLAVVVLARVTWDIFRTGQYEFSVRPRSNHGLDDRSAMRFLLNQRKPGDVLVSTRMGLPAVWWYGGVDVRDPDRAGAYGQDGSPILELRHYWPGSECIPSKLSSSLVNQRRVLLYLAFGSNTPPGFQELTLDRLSELGKMVAYRRIAEEGVAAIFDLTAPPGPWNVVVTSRSGGAVDMPSPARGCVGFHPAARW